MLLSLLAQDRHMHKQIRYNWTAAATNITAASPLLYSCRIWNVAIFFSINLLISLEWICAEKLENMKRTENCVSFLHREGESKICTGRTLLSHQKLITGTARESCWARNTNRHCYQRNTTLLLVLLTLHYYNNKNRCFTHSWIPSVTLCVRGKIELFTAVHHHHHHHTFPS